MNELVQQVQQWAIDKGIVSIDNVPKQMMKVMEELGETCQAILKNKPEEIKDGIGDVFVTMIILSTQLGLDPSECLQGAYNEIKNRTGETKSGIFVKSEDL